MSPPGETTELPTPTPTPTMFSCPCVPQELPAPKHPVTGSPSTYVRPFLRASYTSSRRLG